jgi:hypothetical protein
MPTFPAETRPDQARCCAGYEQQRDVSGAAVGLSARCLDRRAAVRLLTVGALAGPAALRSPSAMAIKGWCRRDPIVKIGDLTVQIILSSDAAIHGRATGPTQLVFHVPTGIVTEFIADDPGFGHFGYDVRFTESHELVANNRSISVELHAYTPAEDPPGGPLPLLLEFFPRGDGDPVVARAEGHANEWISLRANLAARLGESDVTPADAHYLSARTNKKKARGKR